jgi:hypothetical protein
MMTLYDECLAIQCGAVTQGQAGVSKLYDCANAGYVGVKSGREPECQQFNLAPTNVNTPPPSIITPPPTPLTVTDLALVTPSIAIAPVPELWACRMGKESQKYVGPWMPVTDTTVVSAASPLEQTMGSVVQSWFCTAGAWADDNPILALAAVAGVYYLSTEAVKKYQRRRAARR